MAKARKKPLNSKHRSSPPQRGRHSNTPPKGSLRKPIEELNGEADLEG